MMITCKKLIVLIIVLFVLLFVFHSPVSAETVGGSAKVIQLSSQIYRVTFPYELQTNIGVSAGKDGILLVDTGFKQTAMELIYTVKNLCRKEIKYVINTHLHGDHVSGNIVCGKGATLIDGHNLDKCMSYGVVYPGNGELEGEKGIGFDTYFSLNFNGEKIQIIPYPGVHSDSDLLVYFSSSGVVHMGDLLLTQSFPAVGPKVKEYLDFIDKVIAVFPKDTKFIGGHGRDYTLKDVIDYNQMLKETIAKVRAGMAMGKTIDDLKKLNVLQDWESWGEFLSFLNTDYWIESIYKSYKKT
jgi:glyoxylase-like metal-dependent hydrolase (beta-lactamase superfamily II)